MPVARNREVPRPTLPDSPCRHERQAGGVVAQALLAPHLAPHQAAGQVFFFVAVALAVVFGATAVADAKGAAVGV